MAGEKLEEMMGLVKSIGLAGTVDMEQSPGLVAAVDQHTTAVREALGEADARSLRDYLNGFVEAALERGWSPPGHYDWETVRLIAVYRMIEQAGAARR